MPCCACTTWSPGFSASGSTALRRRDGSLVGRRRRRPAGAEQIGLGEHREIAGDQDEAGVESAPGDGDDARLRRVDQPVGGQRDAEVCRPQPLGSAFRGTGADQHQHGDTAPAGPVGRFGQRRLQLAVVARCGQHPWDPRAACHRPPRSPARAEGRCPGRRHTRPPARGRSRCRDRSVPCRRWPPPPRTRPGTRCRCGSGRPRGSGCVPGRTAAHGCRRAAAPAAPPATAGPEPGSAPPCPRPRCRRRAGRASRPASDRRSRRPRAALPPRAPPGSAGSPGTAERTTSSTESIDRWSVTAKVRISATSSPKNSIR